MLAAAPVVLLYKTVQLADQGLGRVLNHVCCYAGTDQASKYVLLGLAVFQFPFAFWMAYRPV